MTDSDADRKPCTIPELTFKAKVPEKVLQKLDESKNLLNTYSQKFVDLRKEIKSIITVVTVTLLTYILILKRVIRIRYLS